MITRKEYMANSVKLHHAYYLQFATQATFSCVKSSIGIKTILKSSDPHFNDIPLRKWDSLDWFIRKSIDTKLKGEAEGFEPGKYGYSLSDTVCISKAVAKEIKSQLIGVLS